MTTTSPGIGGAVENAAMKYAHIHQTSAENSLIETRRLVRAPQHSLTFRCRLYRTVRELTPGKDLYVEVWDTSKQEEDVSTLPTGSELVGIFENHSTEDVKRLVNSFRRDHGYSLRGSWNSRGSI